MACRNRKALTIRAVESAQVAADDAGIEITFTIFDDGSEDGTAEALSSMPNAIRVIRGNGTAFWARSMAIAETAVLEGEAVMGSQADFIVWLNDDVTLDRSSLSIVREAIEKNPGALVIGGMRDPLTSGVTYSGMDRRGPHPLGFGIVQPNDAFQSVLTFNGNFVSVPAAAARALGGIDGGFSHALADIDYGLRCGRLGIPVILVPRTIGTCSRNAPTGNRNIWEEWRDFTGAKGGGNYLSLRRILRKCNPGSWLIVVAATYGLWWARRIVAPRTTRGPKE